MLFECDSCGGDIDSAESAEFAGYVVCGGCGGMVRLV